MLQPCCLQGPNYPTAIPLYDRFLAINDLPDRRCLLEIVIWARAERNIVAGRKSPKSLYGPKIATMEGQGSTYDQSDATGFIRLNAFAIKTARAGRSVRVAHASRVLVSASCDRKAFVRTMPRVEL
ncbi:MAG: hypothetical protein DME59_08005 [Verrucomicrobia bacterium]|nr:MAG: hypothetical protein DME59_08005 [Verrucomicrobiota bacterium]